MERIKYYSMAVVFDTDSSFYFINNRYGEKKKKIVSERHIIQNLNREYPKFNVVRIGGSKIAIYFGYYEFEQWKVRTLIYLIDEDELIQDLDEVINKKDEK